MATYTFSKLTNNQKITLASSDVLAFDGGISAGDVAIDRSVSYTTFFTAGGKTIEVPGSFWTFGKSNFSFDGGGQFIFGDGTTDLSPDATAQKITGTTGNDYLYGSTGADTLSGGAGDDQIYCGPLLDAARDVVSYRSSTAGITVTFYSEHNGGEVSSDGLGGKDTIVYVDDLWGTDYTDSLTLNGGALEEFKLYGGDDDLYLGGGTVATVDGGSGTDTLRFAWSISSLNSGASGGAVTVNLGTGTAKDVWQNTLHLSNIENASGTMYADTLTGSTASNSLKGNPGNDTLNGGSGDDTLAGGADNDSLVGGTGTDTAVFTGSSTNYTIVANADGSTTVTGIDNVGFSYYFTEEGSDTLTGIERLQFDNGEIVTITSTDSSDEATGSTGSTGSADSSTEVNAMPGTAGNDKLTGTSGNDELSGLAGNDQLSGGAGDDVLIGGEGIDKLAGGTGADAFVFDNYSGSGASAADKIADFKISEGDTFVFDTTVFTALAGGISADNVVIGAKVKASQTDDYLIFVTKGGKLYYDADGSGSGAAVQIAGIKGSFSGIDATSFDIQ